MALSVTVKTLRSPAGSLFKGRKVKLVKFVADSSKPSAGYVVTAATLGLRLIEGGVVGNDHTNAVLWSLTADATTASTSTNQCTLQAYTAVGTGATASASHSAASGTVEAIIYGF